MRATSLEACSSFGSSCGSVGEPKKPCGSGGPHLATADRSTWPKTYGGYSLKKAVAQYDLNGILIAEFESIREASRQTGIDAKAIIEVAKGKYSQWNGFAWKYA